MSPPFRSSAAFRYDFCETVDQLEQRLVQPLPDGAFVYVTGTDAGYRLTKGLGNAYDALTQLIVVPAGDTDDRWVKEDSLGASPWFANVISNPGVNIASAAQGAWNALGSTAGTFLLTDGDPEAFELNPTSSLLTYHGPLRRFNVSFYMTLLGTSAAVNVEGAISHDGDIAIGNTDSQYGKGVAGAYVDGTGRQSISGQRTVVLANESTLRIMLRNLTGTQTTACVYSNLCIKP